MGITHHTLAHTMYAVTNKNNIDHYHGVQFYCKYTYMKMLSRTFELLQVLFHFLLDDGG